MDNIKINLQEISWEGVNWILLDEVRDWWQASSNMVINVWVT